MKLVSTLGLAVLLFTSLSANARDDRLTLPVSDAMAAQSKLTGAVAFYWGDQPHPAVAHDYGEFQSNKKTNAFNKSDKAACEWAWLSAMLALEKKAKQLGGNAVVNITSNYKQEPYSSRTNYQCGAGKFVAGTTLKGKVVKLK